MKAVVTLKLNQGYLILEKDIAIYGEDLLTGTAVDTDSFSYRDKVGRVAVDILDVKEAVPIPAGTESRVFDVVEKETKDE